MNQTSTATITEESVNRNQNFLTASPITIHNTDGLAPKLNCLKEKFARYVSHKDFISQCIKSKFVPKGLELTLEPTMGNYDNDFIDNCFSSLKNFSLVLMEQIVSFCDKTEETTIKINDNESILKQQLEKKEYEEKKKTITSKEAATKKILHQQKYKKHISLKYKPTLNVKVKKITEVICNTENHTYSKVTRSLSKSPTRRLSKTNNANNKHQQNVHEKLCSISPGFQQPFSEKTGEKT